MTEKYSDKEIIDGILGGDQAMSQYFFFEKCKSTIGSIIAKVYHHQKDYDELVSDLYMFLQKDDWHKLRDFRYESKLTTWLWTVASNFFVNIAS